MNAHIATDSQAAKPSLLSIVIHDYDHDALAHCLEAIFCQNRIGGFEVIICDNATSDGSWEIANAWMARHPDRITLNRNQLPMNAAGNSDKSIQMAGGKYYVVLTRDRKFDATYIQSVIPRLEADPLLIHAYIGKVKDHRPLGNWNGKPSPELKRTDNPLVSINVHNYNYGAYLRQCLDSIAAQTYGNIEICFSDNASSDESWQIALEFSRHYPHRMSMTRNRKNLGASRNLINCLIHNQGKYMLMLCSDDAMQPDFVERCVTLLERHPDAAFAMVHRSIIDEAGCVTEEPPFYDRTCLIPGEEQAAVYMMAAVNPSISQILYNRERTQVKDLAAGFNTRWFGARVLDFTLCLDHPVVYIKEPLLLNRVHGGSDGAAIDANLMQCTGQYVLLHQLAEIAGAHGLTKAAGRLGEATEKVGRLCLRYCARFLLQNEEATALRYLHLGQAIFPGIVTDDTFRMLHDYWYPTTQGKTRPKILAALTNQANLALRSVSYSAPPSSIECRAI
ncbi:MAG: glycosyltransferase [Gammaproteobacteria bacterium]|nr:glycosyltransferase [Sideroxydans sp.]MBU3904445.1 glycosyltransferase [Gammaproteobacteria bacterium]MBU4046428.1 glycosyltransferase [Gammaproteobacteria bacterium]MBU4150851.1 glycosyltransferase [Gammaproteobacteria bacterium]